MQSSALVSLRVGVLLVALVGLPLVAMLHPWGQPPLAATPPALDVPRMPPPTPDEHRAPADAPQTSLAIAPEHITARPPSEPYGAAPTQDVPSNSSPVPSLSDEDVRLVTIQRRLRELGASYYLLEKWGTEGQLFRFHCRVAFGEGGSANRHFEAINPDARTTMQEVLTQVEAWRGAQ